MYSFISNPGTMVTGSHASGKARRVKKYHMNDGGEEICPGVFCGGEEIEPGTLHGGEEIEPGTLHCQSIEGGTLGASFTPATYRTKDGSAIYKFRYVQVGNHFEIDIIEQPSYQSRDNGSLTTHRITSARGGQQICISAGYKPQSIEKAKKISTEWAELTHQYILTGVSIDKQVRQISRDNKKVTAPKAGGFLNWLFN